MLIFLEAAAAAAVAAGLPPSDDDGLLLYKLSLIEVMCPDRTKLSHRLKNEILARRDGLPFSWKIKESRQNVMNLTN